jgi:hypothetical protein
MTELRAETVRTIDATQEGLDRSLRSIEGRLKAAEEKLEGVLFWSRIPSCVAVLGRHIAYGRFAAMA